MEVKQIEYVLAIAEEKSISRAAERLGISQPALSQQLLRMEDRYGIQFFFRNSRNLKLTPAGELFLANGKKILELQTQTERELLEFSDSSRGSFSVGVSPGRCTMIVANIFPKFMQRYPKYNVRIIESSFNDLSERIQKNDLDLSFYGFIDTMPETKAPFNYTVLAREEILLAISKEHPLAELGANLPQDDLPTANLRQFEKYGFALPPLPANIRTIAEQAFTAADIHPNVVYEVHDLKPLYRVMSNTDLCMLIPSDYISPEKRQQHFHLSPRRYWDFSIMWSKSHFLSEAERYFIELCQEQQAKR